MPATRSPTLLLLAAAGLVSGVIAAAPAAAAPIVHATLENGSYGARQQITPACRGAIDEKVADVRSVVGSITC